MVGNTHQHTHKHVSQTRGGMTIFSVAKGNWDMNSTCGRGVVSSCIIAKENRIIGRVIACVHLCGLEGLLKLGQDGHDAQRRLLVALPIFTILFLQR